MSTSHTIKDIYLLGEGKLYLVHKEMNVRTKLVRKDFGDDLDDSIEGTNSPKLTDHRNTFFLRNESNQSIDETLEVYIAIIELVK